LLMSLVTISMLDWPRRVYPRGGSGVRRLLAVDARHTKVGQPWHPDALAVEVPDGSV
jgi:hypothetical protein